MRVTREHVDKIRRKSVDGEWVTPPVRLPSGGALWSAMAAGGAALAVASPDQWVRIVGVILAAVGTHRIGAEAARRDPTLSTEGLTRAARHSARLELTRLLEDDEFLDAVAASRVEGRAGSDRGALDAATAPPTRPSAAIRGGGRPGATAPLRAIETNPLDRALSDEGGEP